MLFPPRASLATPARCGDYGTEAAFTPWSGTGTVDLVSPGEEFAVGAGAEGSGCPAGSLPFSPGFVTQNTNTRAGGFTNFDLAPFGLDIVTPADAGPFNLGYISVRSKLEVDPENASVRIESDPLPTEIRGIPLQLKRVIVEVNKAGFEFNPTDCASALKVEGTITGAEGASAGASSTYPVSAVPACRSARSSPRPRSGTAAKLRGPPSR